MPCLPSFVTVLVLGMRILLPFPFGVMAAAHSVEGVAVDSRHKAKQTTPQNDIPVIDLTPWMSAAAAAAAEKDNHNLAKSSSSLNAANAQHEEFCMTCSLSTEQVTVVEQIKQACEDIGFFAVTLPENSEILVRHVPHLFHTANLWFDLAESRKDDFTSRNVTEYPYGFERREALQRGRSMDTSENGDAQNVATLASTPDAKETFSVGPSNPASGMPARRHHTAELPAFAPAMDAYYAAMESLTHTLLQIFALALDMPTRYWFDDKMDRHQSALRLLHYYELQLSVKANMMTNNTRHSLIAPHWGIRAGAHSDYGVLTILATDGPGLQVHNATTGEWINVPHIANGFVVNLGDLMQRWTNDRWVSTLHRVVVQPPTRSDTPSATRTPVDDAVVTIPARQSIAYFVNLNGDAVVTPLQSCLPLDKDEACARSLERYPPITAHDHLMAKHLASTGMNHERTARTSKSTSSINGENDDGEERTSQET